MSVIAINFETEKPEQREVGVGDCFLVGEQLIQLVETEMSYVLIDLGNAKILSLNINSVQHAINHVKKHYGEFEVVYSDQIELKVSR